MIRDPDPKDLQLQPGRNPRTDRSKWWSAVCQELGVIWGFPMVSTCFNQLLCPLCTCIDKPQACADLKTISCSCNHHVVPRPFQGLSGLD